MLHDVDAIWDEMKQKGLDADLVSDIFDEKRVREVYEFWLNWAPRAGFFSKSDLNRILERHVFESLVYLKACFYFLEKDANLKVSHETKIADVGSGPGAPGLLIYAFKRNNPDITLIDSSARRLGVVEREFCEAQRFQFEYERIENMANKYKIVFSRAFLSYPVAAEVVTNILEVGGYYFFFTGKIPEFSQQAWVEQYLKKCGFVSCETLNIPELDFLGSRNVIVLYKKHRLERGYPRHWNKIKKSGIKWKK